MVSDRPPRDGFCASFDCAECGAGEMLQVEGGGGLMVWECMRCAAPHTFIRQDGGDWKIIPRTEEGADGEPRPHADLLPFCPETPKEPTA